MKNKLISFLVGDGDSCERHFDAGRRLQRYLRQLQSELYSRHFCAAAFRGEGAL